MTTDATPKPEPGFLVVTKDTTRAEIEEALTSLAATAHRIPWFFPRHATYHARINALLDHWQARATTEVLPRA